MNLIKTTLDKGLSHLDPPVRQMPYVSTFMQNIKVLVIYDLVRTEKPKVYTLLCLNSRMGQDLQLVLSCFVLFFEKGWNYG